MESAKVPVKLVKVTRVLGRTGMQDSSPSTIHKHLVLVCKKEREKECLREGIVCMRTQKCEIRCSKSRTGIFWLRNQHGHFGRSAGQQDKRSTSKHEQQEYKNIEHSLTGYVHTTGSRGGVTQVRVEFMDDTTRSIIRNVKGPGTFSLYIRIAQEHSRFVFLWWLVCLYMFGGGGKRPREGMRCI